MDKKVRTALEALINTCSRANIGVDAEREPRIILDAAARFYENVKQIYDPTFGADSSHCKINRNFDKRKGRISKARQHQGFYLENREKYRAALAEKILDPNLTGKEMAKRFGIPVNNAQFIARYHGHRDMSKFELAFEDKIAGKDIIWITKKRHVNYVQLLDYLFIERFEEMLERFND